MTELHHITINSGHLQTVKRPEQVFIDFMVPFLNKGGGRLTETIDDKSLKGIIVKFTPFYPDAATWFVFNEEIPIISCTAMFTEKEADFSWKQLCTMKGHSKDLPKNAPKLPWLATMIFPTAYLCRGVMPWVADMNQCIAFTAMEICK